MACQFCIGKQKALVRVLCKRPESRLCKKAQGRLEKMLAPEEKDKVARPEGVTSTDPASDHNVR